MAIEEYTDHWEDGVYQCATCGNRLFDSDAKFDAGTGWPSFRSTKDDAVILRPDQRLNLDRTAVVCSECERRLGNFWEDGVERGDSHPEAGDRYCIRSEAISFSSR